MSENPYQSPKYLGQIWAVDELRLCSLFALRATLLVLLVPLVYNYWAFDALFQSANQLPSVVLRYRIIGLGAVTAGSTLIWFFGLLILETISRLLRFLFAMKTDQRAWQEVLYRSLIGSPVVAVPGAILWAAWVFGFYQLQVGFDAISWQLGIPMQLLASGWYLSLAYRWYRLAQVDFPLPGDH